MRTPMREHETSAPSLGELSEAATPGVVTVHEGQPCNHGEDGGGGFTLCFGGLRRTGSGPVVHRFGYAEDIWEDHFPEAFAEAKANIGLLARLWNDYRAGRLIDPTAMAEAVASARAEGWQPIETIVKGRDENGKMRKVLLIAPYPTNFTTMPTWTDVRECWWDDFTEAWERWPHRFPPTHFMPSPAPPTPTPGGSSDV